MNTVPCRTCGSGVLADEPPDECNNCDPVWQALVADAARARVTEIDEVLGLW